MYYIINIYIIYIHTKIQLFLGSLFWAYFGKVLERKVEKTLCFTMVFDSNHSNTIVFLSFFIIWRGIWKLKSNKHVVLNNMF